jgi:hypothetical protein
MFDNEVNKLFAPLFCNSRASRKMFSYRHIASSLCLNLASPSTGAVNFYAAIAEFFAAATDSCSLNFRASTTSSASKYGLALT